MPSAEKSLQGLSKMLASRPALRLDIEGTTDPAADVKTLKLGELKRQAEAARPSSPTRSTCASSRSATGR
jgi:hypothetical protein